MSVDYLVASLPALSFTAPPPISLDRFREATGVTEPCAAWRELECELRNAMAEARGAARFRRPTSGCSLYWKNRVLSCFQEKDVLRRQEALDRVWWDAAGELTPPAEPLGRGALMTYAVRLELLHRRAKVSAEAGNAAFDRLTAETKNIRTSL